MESRVEIKRHRARHPVKNIGDEKEYRRKMMERRGMITKAQESCMRYNKEEIEDRFKMPMINKKLR